MPHRKSSRHLARIGATCDCADARFPISLSDISCDGCQAEAASEWAQDFDYVHLLIDGRIDIKGCVSWHEGKRAGIRFFGQIHPAVIDELERRAA